MYPMNIPDDIVEHIQSFMNFKDAARSATMSTRLYESWYKRKNVVLDDREFLNVNAFWFGAKNTIRRYTVNCLKMESLSLYISCGYERYYDCKKLLQEAVLLGLVDIKIFLLNDNFNFMIPFSVLCSPYLLKFALTGGALHIGHLLPYPSTSLQSLTLLPTRSIGYRGDFIHNIVCQCHSLLHLTCSGFLLWVNLDRLGKVTHNLQTLIVHNLNYEDNLYFNEVIRFFSCLKKVSLFQVLNSDKLHICSESIQQVIIHDRYRAVTAVLRVPNLKCFEFLGTATSKFTFESPEAGWTSYLNVVCFKYDDVWLLSLRKLIQRLAASNVRLAVRVIYGSADCDRGFTGDDEPIEVESLDIISVSPSPQLVEGLFSVCIPKYFQYYPDTDLD